VQEYVDIETGIGTFTVEFSLGGWGPQPYTVWDQYGRGVAFGEYESLCDGLHQVAEDLVLKYLQELEFIG
jgi:hypothetical protein